uniref:Malonyl CoA-acyl carrier protein transacylase n=1 Tax=Candidatus Kentrum sp. FM TaxID=2126340 RepID=A0A450S542_9GAMM|nr:MAG: [acyl-carrier-protein] S-malonyltransferase [Candidatus Kentron sp. FM]VFJ47327.1 MAG: [acyl-carrier-protein] S-malonyltransferase [Candidatus Kentron sp. FM]VFK07555.1 MAG: [acyl-carrier-protein] S-malonyltransferase [Candidatus Kentron sp. FM]
MNIALLFPGQGSQSVGMGRELYRAYPRVRETFDECSDLCGMDLAKLCFKGPRTELNATEYTQPALFTLSLAVHRVLTEYAVTPHWVAGHSLGEITAMAAVGCMDLAAGFSLVRERGRLMAEVLAGKGSTMAAIEGVSPEVIENWLAELDDSAWIANYNAPTQTILSGTRAALNRLTEPVRVANGKLMFLPVSGAFHSPLLASAADAFARLVEDMPLQNPVCPVIGNVTAMPLTTEADIRAELRAQMCATVRWSESMDWLCATDVELFIEVGHGKMLKGLLLRNVRDAHCFITETPRDIDTLLRHLEEA